MLYEVYDDVERDKNDQDWLGRVQIRDPKRLYNLFLIVVDNDIRYIPLSIFSLRLI